jgi:hypothetical protein
MRGSVRGYVAAGERPIAGATISAVQSPSVEGSPGALTDEYGSFWLDRLRQGPWVFAVYTPGGDRTTAGVYVMANAVTELSVDFRAELPPRQSGNNQSVTPSLGQNAARQFGSIRGSVVDARTREPIADAAIVVVRGPGPAPDLSPVTNDTGTFMLDGLKPGPWDLQAADTSGYTAVASVQVRPGEIVGLTIAIDRPQPQQARRRS